MENHFEIKGFHCDSCIKLTKAMLSDIAGVREVKIDGLDGHTEIVSDSPIELGQVQEALKETGYIAEQKV